MEELRLTCYRGATLPTSACAFICCWAGRRCLQASLSHLHLHEPCQLPWPAEMKRFCLLWSYSQCCLKAIVCHLCCLCNKILDDELSRFGSSLCSSCRYAAQLFVHLHYALDCVQGKPKWILVTMLLVFSHGLSTGVFSLLHAAFLIPQNTTHARILTGSSASCLRQRGAVE